MTGYRPLEWYQPTVSFTHATQCERCLGLGHCGGPGTESGCNALTLNPLDPDFHEHLASTAGLDLDVTVARPQPAFYLPSLVPQVDGNKICQGLNRPWVAITLGEWMKRNGRKRKSSGSMSERLSLHPGTRVILLLFANDPLLETWFWPSRHQILEDLKTWKPDVVVAPDFSVWHRDPWMERQWAIVRSLRLYGLLQEHGIAAIPHVFWGDKDQFEQWVRWLQANRVQWISMDLQCQRGPHWSRFLLELAEFRKALDDSAPRLLVNGTLNERTIRAILEIWPETSFTSNVTALAYHRREAVRSRDGSIKRIEKPGADPGELMRRRIMQIEATLERRQMLPWANPVTVGWSPGFPPEDVDRSARPRRPAANFKQSRKVGIPH